MSAFDPGGTPNGFHFQTQLSNREIVVEEYYNQNNSGFGAYIRLPAPGKFNNVERPDGGQLEPWRAHPEFASANMTDKQQWRYGRHDNGKPRYYRMPFMPSHSVSFTPFAHRLESEADRSIRGDKTSPAVGKFTHPSAAPDNHLLTHRRRQARLQTVGSGEHHAHPRREVEG